MVGCHYILRTVYRSQVGLEYSEIMEPRDLLRNSDKGKQMLIMHGETSDDRAAACKLHIVSELLVLSHHLSEEVKPS